MQASYTLAVSSDQSDDLVPWEISTSELNRGFTETGTYRFRSPGPEWEFIVDDEPLPTSDEEWVWEPGFFAGIVRAELIRPDKSLAGEFRLDVSSSPTKLGASEFQKMLDDLWQVNPRLLLGSEPATTPIGRFGILSSPYLEYARLRSHGDAFVLALRRVAERPIRELRAYRDQVPIQQVRRADRLTAAIAVRNPESLGVLAGLQDTHASQISIPRLNVPIVRESLDGAANRCMLALARSVAWRAMSLIEYFQEELKKEESSLTRTGMANRWPRRRNFLEDLLTKLRRIQRKEPFSVVDRAEISAAGLNAVSADPAYARAYRQGWKILRFGVQGPPRAEDLWLSPTWEVYERWCFIKTCQALQEMWPDARVSDHSKHPSGAAAARKMKIGNKVVQILLQPRFSSWPLSANSDYRSISKSREPDILVNVTGPKSNFCIVLDAKYRTTRSSVLDAMTSAHVYRDSLRFKGHQIIAAIVFVPRGGGASWLEDVAFMEAHRVGVITLSPGSDGPHKLLRQWLDLD